MNAPSDRGKLLRANAGLTLVVLFWGSMVPLMALLLMAFDAYFLAAIRYALGLPFLWLFVWLQRASRGPAAPWGRIMALGGAMAAFSLFYTIGIQFSHPVTASVILMCGPIIASILARFMFGQALDRRLTLALPLTVLGGVMVALGAPGRLSQGWGVGGGEALLVCAQVCWNWYSMQAQRWMAGVGQLRMSAVTASAASFWLLLIWAALFALGWADLTIQPPGATLLGVLLWISLTGVALSVVLWNYGASIVGVPMAALFLNLQPLVASLTAYALGSPPSWLQIGGGAVVLTGVLYVQLGRMREASVKAAANV